MTTGIEVPEPNKADAAHAAAKAVISSIPVVGGAAVELFQFIVQPSLEHRRTVWMKEIGERLEKLQNTAFRVDALQNDDRFVSAVLHATQIALRTHHDEKLNALKNALINVATGQAPDEATQHYFFELVGTFTDLHLQMLQVSQAPSVPPGFSRGSLPMVLEYSIHSLHGKRELAKQFWRDLHSQGLVNTEHFNDTLSAESLAKKRTTDLGDALLRFIKEA